MLINSEVNVNPIAVGLTHSLPGRDSYVVDICYRYCDESHVLDQEKVLNLAELYTLKLNFNIFCLKDGYIELDCFFVP